MRVCACVCVSVCSRECARAGVLTKQVSYISIASATCFRLLVSVGSRFVNATAGLYSYPS